MRRKKSSKPTKERIKASVIIITKNQKHFLQKSLPVLLKQDLKEKYEVVIVDSGSNDGAIEYIKKFPFKLVEIVPEDFNYAQAFNLGAEKSQGEILVRLSGDVVPQRKDFLTQILRPFKNPQVGGTYGRYQIYDRKNCQYPSYWPAKRFPKKMTIYSTKPSPFKIFFYFNSKKKLFNFAGGCCALRKKIWEKRPFNEKLEAGEDGDYSWFLHEIGYDIAFNPRAVVLHEHKKDRSLRAFFYTFIYDKYYWQIRREIVRYYFLKYRK